MDAVRDLALTVGVQAACRALGVPRATFYRARRCPGGTPPEVAAPPATTPPAPVTGVSPVPAGTGETPRPHPHPRALSAEERQAVLDALHSPRFRDTAPAEAYATLLDEGTYLASERTMYRLLATAGETGDRRNQRVHPAYAKPELLATGANQVWSWDITTLRGPAKWTYYDLDVLLDSFSRYVVGWLVADQELASLAARLIADAVAKQDIVAGQLTVHADRGSSMTSKPVAFLLADLGITKTHSRPHVSNDNPYSEAQFKTLKYRPDFPARFEGIEEARVFCRDFFPWYNTHHHHAGLGLLTPEVVHYGQAEAVHAARQQVLRAAYTAHPERFVRHAPAPPPVPTAAWINPPPTTTQEVSH